MQQRVTTRAFNRGCSAIGAYKTATKPSSLKSHVGSRANPLHQQQLCRAREDGDVSTTTTVKKKAGEKNDLGSDIDRERRRVMEDELRDPKNFLEYFLPRQLRIIFFGGSVAGCFIASLLSAARLIQEPSLVAATGGPVDLLVNLVGLGVFGGLLYWDLASAQLRVERRKKVRDAQIAFGDREVFVNEEGEKMSRLKEVNDEWILRRLERWGKRDQMPFIGPAKGVLLQQLVAEQRPKLAVEVGSMAGYSAILIANSLDSSSSLISMEKELTWVLVAKRFLWQSSQGEANRGKVTVSDKVDVRWGDARQLLTQLPSTARIDFLLLDGTPKEYLEYLQAAEPYLAEGAMVVADNAGVFGQGGLKPYLEYVRTDPKYQSRYLESTLEWREDVKDGMEVSRYLGATST